MSVYAFDMFDTLTTHADVRALARRYFAEGHEVHVVSAISPGPYDNDEWYTAALKELLVPFTAIHRVGCGNPALKVEVLKRIGAIAFWDNDAGYVDAALAAGFPSCLVGVDAIDVLRTERLPRRRFVSTDLEALYQRGLVTTAEEDSNAPSDIREHMPLLRDLAERCDHVTEFGTRRGNGSTVALLCGQPRTFVTWDVNPYAIVQQQIADLVMNVGRTKFEPRVGDTLRIASIEPTDMLFIDSYHTGAQLLAELQRHACPPSNNVRKYLAFHDTKTFGDVGEDGKAPGLRTAIRYFQRNLAFPLWGLKYDLPNNNGLVVLERIDVEPAAGGVAPDAGRERFK